jgi:hypothetical protein
VHVSSLESERSCICVLGVTIVSLFYDHIGRLELVLQRHSDAGLKLKPEQCQILKPEVTFLGHVVSEKDIHVQPNPDHKSKMLSCPTP